ncbi:hypothetical protein AVEN_17259-1 [Araneus ventricosus]|uniref:Uncharacterized protein n=1 Tax=Araneus ventricosus TaxID=182803 RepID=A0A4Y2LYF9_ARAVE|nr:hypothetical protein AVEN_17259-1 [Araneus ventricosus]
MKRSAKARDGKVQRRRKKADRPLSPRFPSKCDRDLQFWCYDHEPHFFHLVCRARPKKFKNELIPTLGGLDHIFADPTQYCSLNIDTIEAKSIVSGFQNYRLKQSRSNFGQVKFSRINKVAPMRGFTNNVKLHEEEVPIDPYTIFRSISFNRKTESELKNYSNFELAPYPSSLFDEQRIMRKSRISVYYDLFYPVNTPSNIENALYVIDGGFLLHRVS